MRRITLFFVELVCGTVCIWIGGGDMIMQVCTFGGGGGMWSSVEWSKKRYLRLEVNELRSDLGVTRYVVASE